MRYMVTVFAKAVRTVLKEHGFAKEDSNVETGGTFLVGYRRGLYEVCSDFQVNRHLDGFEAVGCGEPFALGAMMALADLEPENRIVQALKIAAHFSGAVCPPFKVLRLGSVKGPT
jgi:ATP-dependent protease HslVU (ClpYQ) peptidase subunit